MATSPEHAFELGIRVRYAETDAQGVVHHANYLLYMEQARIEYMRACGLIYSEMEADGFGAVVGRASMRFHAPAVFDDLIKVRVQLPLVRSRTITFDYRIEHAETGRLLVTGQTTHVFIDDQMKPVQAPAAILDAFQQPAGRPGSRSNTGGPEGSSLPL